MFQRTLPLALLLGTALAAGGALAHQSAHESAHQAAHAEAPPGATEPLYDNLGDLGYPITTDSALAQRYFDQGLRWAYGFNHAAARRAFVEAERQDPACAMCYWGEAYVLGPNINAPMEDAAEGPAELAIAGATARAAKASPKEQALIAALAGRYAKGAERAALNAAYADAMAEAYRRFPNDSEIAVLYVDAVMNTSPWDYWEADGTTPKGEVGDAILAVERVLAANPDHPGAIHFYIHLTEASATPERAEPYAERLPDLMPGAGHMVHMAAHTFYRVGRFKESVELNKRAAQADETYFATAEDHGLWRHGYHPHNIHFAVAAALMAGDAQSALDHAGQLDGKVADEVAAEIGWIQLMKQAPYFAHAHLSDPETILALEGPSAEFPFVRAMWHYARGVALARKGALQEASREAARIDEIGKDAGASYPADIAPAVPEVLEIARHVVQARIAQAHGEWDRAIEEFEVAVEIQDALPYLEPPFWYYPVRQSLGAAQLQAGRPEQAVATFEDALLRVPNNGWALFGLMEAQKAEGDLAAAAATERLLKQAWAGERSRLELSRL